MTDVDLVVAGAGGGLAGALRAAQLGQQVLVVEANEHFLRGNNTSMSTAMIPGAGTRYQRAAGLDDSPEGFLADLDAKTHGQADPVVARALAEVSARLVEWLADFCGLAIELPTDFAYPGHSVQRLHSVPGRHGSSLLRGLHDRVRRTREIDLLVPSTVVDLRPLDRGWRVVVENPDGVRDSISGRTVLLATNGYGANPALVSEHLPDISDAVYHGSEYSRGDALRIGIALGARTGYLDAYQGHGALSAAAQTLITWTSITHGAMLLDASGRRFGDETAGYSEYAAKLAARSGGTGWIVLDERIHELCLLFTDYRDAVEAGVVSSASTVEQLAERMGVAPHMLHTEFAEAGEVVRGSRTADRFGRTWFESELSAPFRAVRVHPALFHTQGGLLVDEYARVLGKHEPIAGLYASGGAAAGISGHGAAGYLAGNGLLPALGLSYLAAEDASKLRQKGTVR